MNTLIQATHWFAGFIVLAEALNKLERTNPCAANMHVRDRFTEILKALAWLLLAIGAGGAVATPVLLWLGVQGASTPLMRLESATFAETAVLGGFAVLIVRTRVKEG
jgi:hypothetical protein